MKDIYLTSVRPSWLQCFLLPSLFFRSLTGVQLSRFGTTQHSEVILGGYKMPYVFESNGLCKLSGGDLEKEETVNVYLESA